MQEGKRKVLMLLFPRVTILDFIAPYDVFRYVPNWEVHVAGPTKGLIQAEGGLGLEVPDLLQDHESADILFIPGGAGINAMLEDVEFLNQLRTVGDNTKYVTSVCTGSLLLAAAGLLAGYSATTHWRSLPLLQELGVETRDERVVMDRNRITAGGITSGMDFALELVKQLEGPEVASRLELWLQYDPAPPMKTGHPNLADPAMVARLKEDTQNGFDIRRHILEQLKEKAPWLGKNRESS